MYMKIKGNVAFLLAILSNFRLVQPSYNNAASELLVDCHARKLGKMINEAFIFSHIAIYR